MNKLIALSIACFTLMACQLQSGSTTNSAASTDAVKVVSLREGNQLAHISRVFPNRPITVEEGGIDVSFDDQPPMIPHTVSIEDERITMDRNECLTCHSKKGAKENEDGAAKAPKSHFTDRNDNKTEFVAARRYFCTQCHYTQQDKAPIVKNNYSNPDY